MRIFKPYTYALCMYEQYRNILAASGCRLSKPCSENYRMYCAATFAGPGLVVARLLLARDPTLPVSASSQYSHHLPFPANSRCGKPDDSGSVTVDLQKMLFAEWLFEHTDARVVSLRPKAKVRQNIRFTVGRNTISTGPIHKFLYSSPVWPVGVS